METVRIPLLGGKEVFLPIEESNYLQLRKAYRLALERNVTAFKWRDMQMNVGFVKYVLEYMEMSPLITDAVKAEDDPQGDE